MFNGIYCAGNDETFEFLENILTEVFQLFPTKYIHIGGDEVPTNNWASCPKDEALIKREGLNGPGQVESYFIRRIEKFVNANGHTLIGWSEITRGGLATNAVVMDWIGGGREAASVGHDVVMAPTDFCYLCYYPSLDRPPNLHAYRPYLPLKQVYAFEPIPTNLEAQYSSHILGTEACVWTPDIPSIKDAEEMAFPRLSALAEIAWSPKSSRNWDDFLRRLNVEYQRLAICGINYWKDTSTEIGEWKPSQIAGQDNILSWDATREINIPGRYRLSLDCGVGKDDLKIKWAKLLEGDQVIASDIHTGFTGTSRLRARDWNYFFDVPAYTKGARYTVQVSVAGEGGSDSSGVAFLGDRTAQIKSNTNQVNSASHLPFQNISPESILTTMQRVADWQLEHPSTNPPASWIQAVGDIGIMALAGISGDAKYRNAMLTMSETNSWQPGTQTYNADDQCIGQVYAELYLSYREPQMIAPIRKEFDFILANPAKPNGFKTSGDEDPWTWCDALFMAPAAWARLYAVTGDRRYLDFAVTNWWRTTDYLYDQQEHLFFRDGTFLKSGESNGKKVFWGRGNGWVMAGMVRTLQCLPINDPARPRFEQLFKDMAEKILVCQQPDGLWRANLLEPESNSLPETSGSGLYTYAFAWGVNQGLLDRAKFEPAVRKAWVALASCVDAGGRLTHVQPAGKDPQPFAEDSTAPYGVGAFLLAGSEMYKLTLLEKSRPMEVKVKNPAAFYRESETIELNLPGKLAVMDGLSAQILDSQSYQLNNEEKLLFQVDLEPNESRTFYILNTTNLISVPPPIVKTFARYVPERADDFAWESDRIAHRIYGQALIKAEGTISSGQDVWIKKNRGLIVNRMYDTKNYHYNNGEFMDDYRVGNSRGCGGLGIWDGQKLFVSSNWRNWTLITSGPIRSEFELTYDAWNAGEGRLVSETKHFSIDAGSWFTKVQSTLTVEDKLPLTVGIGLAERACGPGGKELVAENQAEGWMSYWQP
ncbi:MAG TPA: glycoside hydrolase family 88 protein, partial [Candidatus Acidoferrum sp.]|nr:glycoside hydrolase family 88 protein [Candidatus Acidoferrum sp.]